MTGLGGMKLVPINTPSRPEGSQDDTLEVIATPGTDLWHKPPSQEVSNAPCYVAFLPANNFRHARVTVSADWTRQYDQGGLVLFLPQYPSHSLWVKTGVEFVDGKPYVSVVAARDAADWSLLPGPAGQTKITLEIEREEVNEKKGTGASLWVYLVEGKTRTAIREVTWVFKEKEDLAGLIGVGIYAARPTKNGESDVETLRVTFDDLSIQ